MAKHGSADFYEAYKRHRDKRPDGGRDEDEDSGEYSSEPQLDLDEDSEYGEDSGHDADYRDDSEDSAGDLSAIDQADAAGTVSSVHVEFRPPSPPVAPEPEVQVQAPSAATSSGAPFVKLFVVGLAVIGAYVAGRVHGKGGSLGVASLLESSDPNPALSASQPEGTAERTEVDEVGSRRQEAQKVWILVLCTYKEGTESTARIALQKLKEKGYARLGLAREGKFIYLYNGPYEKEDDKRLKEYKTLFSTQKDFRECFLKSVHMRL